MAAPGAAWVLAGVLAAMLMLAESRSPGGGTWTIDINSGARRLQVAGGESLLRTLKREGIFLPSACGGRGACGYCRCRITAGGGPVTPAEERRLTASDRAGGMRLGCQVKVLNDLSIEVPEELLVGREYRGVVEQMRDLTHDIKELRIRLVEPKTIDFVPGQYVQLEAPPYGQNREGVLRAFSMSSPPSDKGCIELIIRLVPGGICTTWVFTALEEGDGVKLNGPHGKFHLSDTNAEMIWIAGGSGMAPFWSLVRHMKGRRIVRPCTYFFGAVQRRDLFLVEELAQLEKELPWFRFIPALSGPGEGEGWSGERGLITEVVDRHVQDGSGKEAYLCGSPGMIDASIKVLKSKGITDERIFYDKFA